MFSLIFILSYLHIHAQRLVLSIGKNVVLFVEMRQFQTQNILIV